jgi:hypothetical protein
LFFERYDKNTIEEFALRTISKSFDDRYKFYFSPKNPDNFDFISPNNTRALEVTLAISSNDMEGYKYEKLYAQGKRNLSAKHIVGSKLSDSGELVQWCGGPFEEILIKIEEAIIKKEAIAQKRLSCSNYECVDLCVCIDDGGCLFENDFPLSNLELNNSLFENIFFITSKLFYRYTKQGGYEQYKRVVK